MFAWYTHELGSIFFRRRKAPLLRARAGVRLAT